MSEDKLSALLSTEWDKAVRMLEMQARTRAERIIKSGAVDQESTTFKALFVHSVLTAVCSLSLTSEEQHDVNNMGHF